MENLWISYQIIMLKVFLKYNVFTSQRLFCQNDSVWDFDWSAKSAYQKSGLLTDKTINLWSQPFLRIHNRTKNVDLWLWIIEIIQSTWWKAKEKKYQIEMVHNKRGKKHSHYSHGYICIKWFLSERKPYIELSRKFTKYLIQWKFRKTKRPAICEHIWSYIATSFLCKSQ